MALLDDVRAQAAATAASARFVTIDAAAIEAYAQSLPLEQASAPALDPDTHYSGEPEATQAYVVTLDAINFGSGYFPHLKKRPGMSGYFTVASSLKDYFEIHGPLSANDLQRLTIWDCARIFGQTLEDPTVAELMGLFARALNELGRYLELRYAGSFRQLVEAADQSAERLAEDLTQMPFYRDVGFYKRAQLTAADLSIAGVGQFDLDRLTIFADNLVPHVLRMDGILRYEAGLLERIDREELIPAGSREERDIRACAVHAVELMRRHVEPVTSMQLDYILWNRGQAPAYKAQPRHRTRTVFY
jgi:Potential Queuosine, Q, salvage protein family